MDDHPIETTLRTVVWRQFGAAIDMLENTLVQEHAAHLSLFLGQHGIPDEALNWVGQAKGDPSC